MILDLFRAAFAPPRDLILLVAAGWGGIALADRRARDLSGSDKLLDGLIGAMTLAFLVGGRLFFLAAHLQAFLTSPASLLSLNTSLFDTWGGLLCAAITAAVAMQRHRCPVWETLDSLTPFFASLAIGLALSHLASGTAFGRETRVPWATYLWGAWRHPTQIYELIAGVIALGIIWLRKDRIRPGAVFLLWVALTAGSRLLIEGFRGDSVLTVGGFRLAQIVAWLILAGSLIALERLPGQGVQGTAAAPPLEKE